MCKLHNLSEAVKRDLHMSCNPLNLRMAEALDQRVQLVCSKGQIRAIDEWRRRQPDLPSRSGAIRRLIEAGLNAEGQGEQPPSPRNSRQKKNRAS
jgi:hypothetical protein